MNDGESTQAFELKLPSGEIAAVKAATMRDAAIAFLESDLSTDADAIRVRLAKRSAWSLGAWTNFSRVELFPPPGIVPPTSDVEDEVTTSSTDLASNTYDSSIEPQISDRMVARAAASWVIGVGGILMAMCVIAAGIWGMIGLNAVASQEDGASLYFGLAAGMALSGAVTYGMLRAVGHILLTLLRIEKRIIEET